MIWTQSGGAHDDGLAGSPDLPLRRRRDRQRKLALQKPRLIEDRQRLTDPRSPRLRNPDQLRRGKRYRPRPSQKGGQFWTPIRGQFWTPIDTMDASFCVAALEEALARYGKPEIFNTDQGSSQFTGSTFTGALVKAGVRISTDGRGRWMGNVFIERLWRSMKYEDVYLKGYADGREAIAGEYFVFYNEQRLHQALAYRAPMAVWPKADQKRQQTEPLAA